MMAARLFFLAAALFTVTQGTAQAALHRDGAKKPFVLSVPGRQTVVCYDADDAEAVKRSAEMFAGDVTAVTGRLAEATDGTPPKNADVVIVGSLGRNAVIDRLVAKKRIDTAGMSGGWEQYSVSVVERPAPGIARALVIAGSDRRGAAYGLLSVSEEIGVSPWYWWADVPIPRRESLRLDVKPMVSKAPSVRYRGIFINDEDWGLKPWAAKTFEKDPADIGPKTYEKICELLLRLKANYLSPAMHSCTKAFNHYPENKTVADAYGIVMGSIHCEPLLFNNASEWDRATMGEWNYMTNRDGINSVLRERVRQNGAYENVYTLAMRGIHDAVMAGGLTLDGQARTLEKAFGDQRDILAAETGTPASEIPQVFYPYKEVLETYEHGLDLPDDVTIVWSEDDFGYIKRLSNSVERKRSGRSGVYYHVSYWGPPKHYLWIASTPPALMYGEMEKAYRATADRLWVVNVGDIKPAEYLITLFMDMAWDMGRFSFDNVGEHGVDFLCRAFGGEHRSDFRDILESYYRLAFARKPEFMERSTDTEFSVENYGELDRRMAEYARIGAKAERIMHSLPEESVPAFFQLVYYPVRGADLVNGMTLGAQKQRFYAAQGRASAGLWSERVKSCGDSLELITRQYNELLDGKWNGMMSLVHGGARSFERGRTVEVGTEPQPALGVWCGGSPVNPSVNAAHSLPCFNEHLSAEHYFDVFNRGQGTLRWNAEASAPWIRLSENSGETRYDRRINVSVDWEQVPAEVSEGYITVTAGGRTENIRVPLLRRAADSEDLRGLFVETNGYVSIPADGYHRSVETADIRFRTVEGLGMEGKVVQLGDPFAAAPHLDGLVLTSNYVAPVRNDSWPRLEYDFYTFGTGAIDVYTYMMPIFPLDDEHGSRYGVMVDNSPVYLPEAGAPYYSTPWIQSVLRNCRINKTTHFINSPGKHTLRIYCAHPGMMIQKIVIDTGGLRHSYSGPPSTKAE